MLNQIRAQLQLFYGLLEKESAAAAVVVRRDAGVLHDELLKAEKYVVTVPVEWLHELKKHFTTATEPALVKAVDEVIKYVDDGRAAAKPPLPPSGPVESTAIAPPAAATPTEAPLAPAVPFEAAPAPTAPAPGAA